MGEIVGEYYRNDCTDELLGACAAGVDITGKQNNILTNHTEPTDSQENEISTNANKDGSGGGT
jgi:hypothetical protein